MSKHPDIASILKAATNIRPFAVATPLLESPLLNETVGGRVFIKAECLQRTGSFKFRGALNKLSTLSEQQLTAGVVAYSSGNHAQGVAAAAGILYTRATIVMPSTAPRIKIDNTRALGANVVEYDPETEVREQLGQEIAQRTGAILVRPYDDPDVISGQGTAGLEICDQLSELNQAPDQIVCPCGGGGLIAGISLAVHASHADCRIYCAEPAGFDDTARSLKMGKRVRNSTGYKSVCDAIVTPEPGELTFKINKNHLHSGIAVTDPEVFEAMRVAFEKFKLVVEPGGAAALAAIVAGKIDVTDQCTVVVCSGGNVDAGLYSQCLRD